MNANSLIQRYHLETKPACVLADGPQETDADGSYEYTVCFGDNEGEPITENPKCVWRLWEHEAVLTFAAKLAKDYNLELVNETMPA